MNDMACSSMGSGKDAQYSSNFYGWGAVAAGSGYLALAFIHNVLIGQPVLRLRQAVRSEPIRAHYVK